MEKISFYIAKGLKIFLNPPALRNSNVNKKSRVCSGSELNHVNIDRYSYVGNRCFLVNVDIGKFCSIADRCCIGGATHPMYRVSTSPVFHEGKNIMKKNFSNHKQIETAKTIIKNDVWIGMGCYIKSGVTINNGAILGMGSVLTKDIPAYEIWAGNPAKKIGTRFDVDVIEKLLNVNWWEWNDEKLDKYSCLFDDVDKFLEINEVCNK